MPFSDPEKKREYYREYMARRREKKDIRESEAGYKADWYQRNKERKAENQRKWRARRKEEEG